jgi:hypothetical protein
MTHGKIVSEHLSVDSNWRGVHIGGTIYQRFIPACHRADLSHFQIHAGLLAHAMHVKFVEIIDATITAPIHCIKCTSLTDRDLR